MDSMDPCHLSRTATAGRLTAHHILWLPEYYAHSNHILLRKDDTSGLSLTRHSAAVAVTPALGYVSAVLILPSHSVLRTLDEDAMLLISLRECGIRTSAGNQLSRAMS
jgi:hypothetical protein